MRSDEGGWSITSYKVVSKLNMAVLKNGSLRASYDGVGVE